MVLNSVNVWHVHLELPSNLVVMKCISHDSNTLWLIFFLSMHILDSLSSLPDWKEFAGKLKNLLIEWSDIECRRTGHGHLTKECTTLGVYDMEIMDLVHSLQRLQTEVITSSINYK